MTLERRRALQRALDAAERMGRQGVDPLAIIGELEREHGACYAPRWDRSTLRCAGVSSSCTWGAAGLIGNWRKLACIRLAQAAMAGVKAA